MSTQSSEEKSDTRVLVTGASGFIASHLVQQLLQEGYLVRGTVRSLTNPLKVDPLKKLNEAGGGRLELVEAELTNEECWKNAVEGCMYVYHTASPLPIGEPDDENDVIKPAVEGTLNVLKACTGKVKRVVLTSSFYAMGDFHCKDKTLTEDDWTDITLPRTTAYIKSKTLAEKAAWDYLASLEGDQKFELAAVNPSLVLGPALTKASCVSIEIIRLLLDGRTPALPKVNFSIVDVRDVARSHIAAMTVQEAAGHRHLLRSGDAWFSDIAKVLKAEFGPQGYNVTTRVMPYFLAWIVALFDPNLRILQDQWGIVTHYDNTRMREVLKVEPISVKDTVIQAGYSLIENGIIQKTKEYGGIPENMGSA